MQFINVADLHDPSDSRGRSYREVNAEKVHKIPLGSLVEIEASEDFTGGARLFVMAHTRDCDKTPLYSLCHDPDEPESRKWAHGYSEESLRAIRKAGDDGS